MLSAQMLNLPVPGGGIFCLSHRQTLKVLMRDGEGRTHPGVSLGCGRGFVSTVPWHCQALLSEEAVLTMTFAIFLGGRVRRGQGFPCPRGRVRGAPAGLMGLGAGHHGFRAGSA